MQLSYTSMIWTKQLSGTDTAKRPVMSPKRHLRCRKIFRIIVEQLHPIGMTSYPDVSSVRVNRQVIDQSVQLQRLHRKNKTQKKNQKIKSIRNTGSKLQHNHQICLIWQNIDWGFFNKHFSPHFCFVFSPGMHHPHPCAMRNLLAALGFPHQLIHTYTSVDAFSDLIHTAWGRFPLQLHSIPKDSFLLLVGGWKIWSSVTGCSDTSANPQEEPPRPELYKWACWNLKHSSKLFCPKSTSASFLQNSSTLPSHGLNSS